MRSDPIQRPGFAAATLAACGAAILGGCAVGPDYHRPAVDSPPAFRGDGAVTNASFAESDWWQVYRDDVLQALIRQALTNNYDLRIAAARVEQSRALAAQAGSQFFPSATYSGVVSRGRNSLFGSPFPDNGATTGSVTASLSAFWEVDLWGRVRRLNEAARAKLLATEEARRGVRLSLLSDVATAYLQLVELDQEIAIASRATNSFADSLKIFTRRVAGGTASELESSRAEAALADAAAAIPFIQNQISVKENQIRILLGRNPGPVERQAVKAPEMPPQIPAGLPSELLERRPDLREAEQLLRSANAQVGESVAEFFPKIGLTTFLGRISPQLSAFTLGGANAWGAGAEVTGPLFEGGRLAGVYRQSKAARDEARLRYQQTALTAFREVSDALVARGKTEEIGRHRARQASALERSVKLASERYSAGKASYYEVLEAQQQLFPAELELARAQTDQRLAVVALYKALGGGWREDGAGPHSAPDGRPGVQPR